MKAGRTHAQKRALVLRITEAMVETCGAVREHVHVIITDVEGHDWGRGGDMLSGPPQAAAPRETEKTS
jgi:4-oxalocrotonate tautomerase family enzyme